ncbi:MAG: hypothetical protein MI862_17990 [Desulfobacterales bacterium]|nr:hypothetical protein [Desulfobacterales bacterium]
MPAFFVASIGTYFNMLQLMRLEVEQKSFALLGILKFPWPLSDLKSGPPPPENNQPGSFMTILT